MSSLEKSLKFFAHVKNGIVLFELCFSIFSSFPTPPHPCPVGVDPKGAYTVGKHSTIELRPSPSFYFSSHNFY